MRERRVKEKARKEAGKKKKKKEKRKQVNPMYQPCTIDQSQKYSLPALPDSTR